MVLYGGETPPDGVEAWPHSAQMAQSSATEMAMCFSTRELFARALAAPKPPQVTPTSRPDARQSPAARSTARPIPRALACLHSRAWLGCLT